MMSYDVWVGKTELNITYNLSNFFAEYLGQGGLNRLYGRSGLTCVEIVLDALVKANNDMGTDKFHSLSSPNGWGTAEQGVEFLEELLLACARNPDANVEIH